VQGRTQGRSSSITSGLPFWNMKLRGLKSAFDTAATTLAKSSIALTHGLLDLGLFLRLLTAFLYEYLEHTSIPISSLMGVETALGSWSSITDEPVLRDQAQAAELIVCTLQLTSLTLATTTGLCTNIRTCLGSLNNSHVINTPRHAFARWN
jgi:hypothetical protein